MPHTQALHAAEGRMAWLGHNHGYRIAGDIACLNAEFGISHALQLPSQQWALQLWACDAPYAGGALSGTKIAETTLDCPRGDALEPQRCYAETFARLPAGDRDYSMVLVLASRNDAREQVHDFANYPAREHFLVPSLRGAVSVAGHDDDEQHITLRIEHLDNPRSGENLSGSLALELWALAEPYTGGVFVGEALAGVEIGRLAGQESREHVEYRLALVPAPENLPHRALMLREWTADGYVTRDYRGFPASSPAPAVSSPAPAVPAAKQVLLGGTQEARSEPPAAAVVVHEVASAVSGSELAQQALAPSNGGALVSIQRASLDELARVPGLNRKLASEIVKARPFRAFEDLVRIRGIGEKTLRKLRSVLAL